MTKYVYILFYFLAHSIGAQVTFIVNELPDHHDYTKPIYISGEFEGWSGGHEDYKLEQTDEGYTITLSFKENTVLYKFTQGSWNTVEKDAEGNNTDNRVYKKSREQDTVFVKISRWDKADDSAPKSSAASNVSVISEEFDMPQLDRKRRVWIYLPPDYDGSEDHYPVLYMHDGQNVFETLTSYAGEWQVDETLNKLFDLHNFRLIVVAIDNGGEKRLNEYSPWDNERFGNAEGDAYVDFITHTLKPYIDTNFRTKQDSANTGIMGSSMGGLISHYAALKYPDVYGKAGIFSPSFWYSSKSYDYTSKQAHQPSSKLYFLVGGNEGDTMVPDMKRMIELMKTKGYSEAQLSQKVVEEGVHSESFWKNEFEEAVLWLFPNAIKQRTYRRARINGNNQLEIQVSDGTYFIHYYSPEIVETNFIPGGEEANPSSHAVVMKPETKKGTLKDQENRLNFTYKEFQVTIQKEPFKIGYSYKGKPVTSEQNGYRKIGDYETIQLTVSNDEVLYGGGARAMGMNRRGHRLRLYNRAHYGYETESTLMNFTMPIVISSNQYMIHFDNAPIGYLDLDSKQNNTITYETISGKKTYQIIVGKTWKDLTNNYTKLTGKQPLPPRWAFGNFASRFGYHSQAEVEAVVSKFKEEQIPLDAVIIDIYWFGKSIKGEMGNLEWLRDSFPQPKQMINDLKKQGVKTVLVTEPFILTTSKKWEEAVEENVLAVDSTGQPARYDFYFGNTGIIDIYDQKGESWFWNIYKGLAEQGVAGVWGDLGEPEVHPHWVQHATGSANEVHNTYGHDWARLVYEGYQRDFPEQRPFILMRAGYSGSQRFGMIPWSGDVNRTWGGLQSQTEIALQMGMQGLGYMHSDLGGFAGANLDDELYVRWLQYGVFNPIFRPHAQEEVPSEPVFRSPQAKKLAKQAIELRYRMLPYNYNLAYENHTFGLPFMRPLLFEEPNNPEVLQNADTYLWGNDVLVTPIVNPGVTEKAVYFPKSHAWFDFYTDERIEGGQTRTVPTSEDRIPTYIRAGAFLPLAKLVSSIDNYSTKELEIHYYHDTAITKSRSDVYDDNGKTPNALEKEQYELMMYRSFSEKDVLEFDFSSAIGDNYTSMDRSIQLVVHNVNRAPKKIRVNGNNPETSQYDATAKTLTIPFYWKKNNDVEIKIKF